MIRELGRSVGNAVLDGIGRASSRLQRQKPLPSDLLESEDAYLVVFDAPGVESSDVQVRYADDRVEVRIDRFREFHEGYEMRLPGRSLSLDGAVSLPADAVVEAREATATLKTNGTLEIRLPKGEAGESGTDEPTPVETEPAETGEDADAGEAETDEAADEDDGA
jgi:HSP20 family molecular chaperone IbpA